MVVAGQLPDCLDVACLALVTVVDSERQGVLRSAVPGHRVEEPVRLGYVRALRAEHRPVAREYPIRRRDDTCRGLRRDLLDRTPRQRRRKRSIGQ